MPADGPAVSRVLPAAVEQFGLRQQDFLAVIDGMTMDAVEDIRAPEWSKLDLYCDRVASAVGRLSVRVFGLSEWDGVQLARHLGRALQLTNILRDLDEDADIGRLYLPGEALRAAGIAKTDPLAVLASPGLGAACAEVVERARGHFDEADKVMARCARQDGARAADHGARSIERCWKAWWRAAGRHHASAFGRAAGAFLGQCCGTQSSDVAHDPHHRRRLGRPCRRDPLGGERRCRSSVHEATVHPGGRCRSYRDQATGMMLDNGNHLVLSGNRAVLGVRHEPSAARHRNRGRTGSGGVSCSSIWRPASDGRCVLQH